MASFNSEDKDGCERLLSFIMFVVIILVCVCGLLLALWLRYKLHLLGLVPLIAPLLAIKNAYTVHPHEIEPGDIFPYMIVAVAGWGYDDWVAYRGPADWTPQQVADDGDKIDELAARLLFPTLAARGPYRS